MFAIQLAGASAQPADIQRILIEGERFSSVAGAWRPIRVGEGNYFVDSIGAGHYSGGQMLHLGADESGAVATDTVIPRDGRYRIWARYDYPWRKTDATFQIRIEQDGGVVFTAVTGYVVQNYSYTPIWIASAVMYPVGWMLAWLLMRGATPEKPVAQAANT